MTRQQMGSSLPQIGAPPFWARDEDEMRKWELDVVLGFWEGTATDEYACTILVSPALLVAVVMVAAEQGGGAGSGPDVEVVIEEDFEGFKEVVGVVEGIVHGPANQQMNCNDYITIMRSAVDSWQTRNHSKIG